MKLNYEHHRQLELLWDLLPHKGSELATKTWESKGGQPWMRNCLYFLEQGYYVVERTLGNSDLGDDFVQTEIQIVDSTTVFLAGYNHQEAEDLLHYAHRLFSSERRDWAEGSRSRMEQEMANRYR